MTRNKEAIDNIIYTLKSLFYGNDMVYVSTPINTGKRYIDLLSSVDENLDSLEFEKLRAKIVVEPNILNAKEIVDDIRKSSNKIIIDPTTLENDILQWSQEEFYYFWDKVIEVLIKQIIFLDGWEYSLGCCYELLSAIEHNVEIYTQDIMTITVSEAVLKIHKSIDAYPKKNMQEKEKLINILAKIENFQREQEVSQDHLNINTLVMKDEKLNTLSANNIANVAQFISFTPNTKMNAKFVHINNFEYSNELNAKELIKKLINSAPSKSVNLRSYGIDTMKGNALIFNKKISDIDEIIDKIEKNSLNNKYTIINENIDICDGGVSGVALGNILEFAPKDTPKCVDTEGVCSLPRELGMKILNKVYGFMPDINFISNFRVEFSIHPSRQGVEKKHTVIWEYEYYDSIENDIKIQWPNRFSKFIGDKAFGLLIADCLGIKVPKTTVISRNIAPFTFGKETGLNEKWIRTCPIIKEPGKYYTGFNWTDPYLLMVQEESKGRANINIASILSQAAVEPIYSGASFIRSDECFDVIEGVVGKGDEFMIGIKRQDNIPDEIIKKVKKLNNTIRGYHNLLGDVSIEWVFDGINAWVVQLNQLKDTYENNYLDRRIIVNGSPSKYVKVYVKDGLESLRRKIEKIKDKDVGIELIGNIGVTSHFGDLLRQSKIPSHLVKM